MSDSIIVNIIQLNLDIGHLDLNMDLPELFVGTWKKRRKDCQAVMLKQSFQLWTAILHGPCGTIRKHTVY